MNFQKKYELFYELFKDANARSFFATVLVMVSTWVANYFHFNAKLTCLDVAIWYIPMIIFFMIVNYHKYSYEHLANSADN